MKLYYSKLPHAAFGPMCPCGKLRLRGKSAGQPFADALAGRLFPHQEFYNWLAYGHGEKALRQLLSVVGNLDYTGCRLWPKGS